VQLFLCEGDVARRRRDEADRGPGRNCPGRIRRARARPPAAAQQPIKVGVIYGLGGAAAPYTKPAVTGHEMAVEEINAAGGVLGRKLQLVIRDDQSKPDVGVREARDLILKEKVDFLTGIITVAWRSPSPRSPRSTRRCSSSRSPRPRR
jgi:hypothetical protein